MKSIGDMETDAEGEEAFYKRLARQGERRWCLDGTAKGSHFRRRLVAGGIAGNG